jgi:TolB protein
MRIFRFSNAVVGILVLTSAIATITSIHAKGAEDRIVFTSGGSDLLFLVDGLQGKPEQLSHKSRPSIYHPSVSSDGKEVVFISFPNIARMDIATRQVELLTNNRDPRTTTYSNLDWSLDGSSIVFLMSTDGDRKRNVCIMNIHSRDVCQLTDSDGIKSRPSWSPDGSKIVYAKQDPQSYDHDLYVVDNAGDEVINITKTPDTDELFPVWLSDNRIAFLSPIQALPAFGVFKINMDGLERHRLELSIELSTVRNSIRSWVWSPDGTQLLLSRQIRTDGSSRTRQYRIYLIDVASRTKTRWIENGCDPDWVKPGYVSSTDAKKDG